VVAVAILGMARALTPDRQRASLAIVAMMIAFATPSAWGQISAILLGGAFGIGFLRGPLSSDQTVLPLPVSRSTGALALSMFILLLIGLPLLAAATDSQCLRLFDTFYRVGSLVFGGGHVVLPLLKAEVVPGLVNNDAFLAGYGAAQAVPGPLFTFAAYLGAIIGGWKIAVLCLVGIFLPSFLLVVGVLPFWDVLRKKAAAQAALAGVNAAVVGLLLAAFYDPVWTAAILTKADYALGAAAFLLLFTWKTPPWVVVLLCAAAGQALTFHKLMGSAT
jgi:chromate transporter